MFQYFDTTSSNFSEIQQVILGQGVKICREYISPNYIKKAVKDVSWGFVNYGKIAKLGQKRASSPVFVLCKIVKHEILIDLICARPNTKQGRDLMKLAEDKAKENGYIEMTLLSILDEKIAKWYEKQGYQIYKTINFDDSDEKGKPKVYYMKKVL